MQAVMISLKGKGQRPYASADSVSWIVTQNIIIKVEATWVTSVWSKIWRI